MTEEELTAIEAQLKAASGEARSFAMAGALSSASRLLAEVRSLRAERDALRKQAEAAEAERDVLAEKWGGMVDDNGDPLDASGILEYVCTLREELSHMQAERDALRKSVLDLLAVVHGDGGHHTGSVGLQQSFADAERTFYALRTDAAMLREAIDKFLSFQGSTREPEGQAALNAALAVQP